MEQNLKQENATSDEKAAVLEGIIYLLLSSRLEVGKYTNEKMDINISNINAMLSAA